MLPAAYYQKRPAIPGMVKLKFWFSIVEAYAQMRLTFPEDKLPALSEVAKYFQTIFGDEYLAGIWRDNLDYLYVGLGWHCQYQDSLLPIPEPSRALTWSWASTDNPVALKGYDSNYSQKLLVRDA